MCTFFNIRNHFRNKKEKKMAQAIFTINFSSNIFFIRTTKFSKRKIKDRHIIFKNNFQNIFYR